jgi:hypothetical protein
MAFENRSGADIWVREHRKRRKPSFAGQHHLNIDAASEGVVGHPQVRVFTGFAGQPPGAGGVAFDKG